MSLRTIFGDLLIKMRNITPPSAKQRINDPLNYLADCYLHADQHSRTALIVEGKRTFPSLSQADAEAVVLRIYDLQNKAAELATEVNRQQLTQQLAHAQLAEAFPGFSAANVASILMKNLIDSR